MSREWALSAFEIDIERDVVRSLTGSPEDEGLAKRLSVADTLGLNAKRQLPELPKLSGREAFVFDSEPEQLMPHELRLRCFATMRAPQPEHWPLFGGRGHSKPALLT